jgi:hypothetical protein
MSKELESARAMVVNLGLNLKSMVLVTMRPRPSRQLEVFKFDNPHCPVRIMFHVTENVRFLLERGLRFRDLAQPWFLRTCSDIDSDHDVDLHAPVPIYYPDSEGLAFVPPFLEGMVHLSVIRILRRPTVLIRDLNGRFGGLQASPGLRFTCCRHYQGASCA